MGLFLLRCSICLFLCQWHTVGITTALQYILKLGCMMPLALLFFLKSALANQHLLYFLTNFRNVCSSYVKNAIGILIGIALNLLIALVL